MKKFILSALLVLSSVASAQQGAVCGETKKVMETMERDFGEYPILILQDPATNVTTVITANTVTSSWTLFVAQASQICMVNAGQGFSLNTNPTPPKKNPNKTL